MIWTIPELLRRYELDLSKVKVLDVKTAKTHFARIVEVVSYILFLRLMCAGP